MKKNEGETTTVGGPFYNWTRAREITRCSPKFSLQRILLEHIKQH